MVREIELRRDAGQHLLAMSMCNNFPVEGVAGETRLKVGDILKQYEELKVQGDRVLSLIDEYIAALPNDRQKDEIAPIREEIATDLSIHNLDRFADFIRLADDEKMKPDQKLSLAISGWFLGGGEATENLSVAIALYSVRNLIADYMRSTHEGQRAQILADLEKYEGGTPRYVARLMAMMKPPVETEGAEKLPPGTFEISVPGPSGEANVTYFVQLPPEYNPYRRYPAVVTLHSAMTTPLQQIAWWAGDYQEKQKMRLGQASRRGYIVIAPKWGREHQTKYDFSAQEHAAVMFSVRDALQRFSIDTDKVFLSGHSMGGDAAWDIALAHPDVWAGVMPIGASTEKYILRYYGNGKYVPLYYVAGEMDGDRFAKCSQVLDKYLKYVGYDAVVVQYQGRGHEHFYDDIQNMFGWMEYHRRDPLPKDFACVSMRPWDNFFWWVEIDNIPPKLTVLPAAWPAKGAGNAVVDAKLNSATSISVKASAGCKVTLYLTPEMVNFENRFTVTVNGSSKNITTQPSLQVLLEDARTRGDRLHPFWQKLELK
jgi:pimeloyl-ACP methyl ester carboxylesterase